MTGEVVQGTKIEYVEDWDPQPQQNKRGLNVLSANFPRLCYFSKRWGMFRAVYSADFQLVAGARGRAAVSMTNLHYREPFKPFANKSGGAK